MTTISTVIISDVRNFLEMRKKITALSNQVFLYWHQVYEDKKFKPSIDDFHIEENGVTFETREYIGCGEYEYFRSFIPYEILLSDNYRELISKLKEEKDREKELERIREQEEEKRIEAEKQEARVQHELEELARLEAKYRGINKEEIE